MSAPTDWVLVPRLPTAAMAKAASRAVRAAGITLTAQNASAAGVAWAAMLDAAPTPFSRVSCISRVAEMEHQARVIEARLAASGWPLEGQGATSQPHGTTPSTSIEHRLDPTPRGAG